MGFGKDGKGVIITEARSQALGTLAAATALIIGTNLATLERFRMLRGEVFASIIGVTSGELNGLVFGIADGDLTLAEIEEAIENGGPLGPNDTVQDAIAMRLVKFIGMTDRETGTELVFHNHEGGHRMVTKPCWTFARTKSWNWFVYNMGVVPTTGAIVLFRSKSFGVWVT